jgi:hypothetical protein
MRTKISTTQRIRTLIDKGHNNKAIIEKLKCKPQAVYNIRYQMNKERGLGSIGALPKPTDGIGAPPKRKYTRKVKAGELASLPEPVITTASGEAYVLRPYPAPVKAEGEPVYMPITMIETPTLWQRVKGWFRG